MVKATFKANDTSCGVVPTLLRHSNNLAKKQIVELKWSLAKKSLISLFKTDSLKNRPMQSPKMFLQQ
jgi:hypothetical protein